jgi:hypothetical protein
VFPRRRALFVVKEKMMDWRSVLSTFVQVFLTALAPVIASMLAAWLLQQYKLTRAKLAPEQLRWLDQVAVFAVLAAEQSNLAGLVTEKRDYAFGLVEKQLAQYGYKFDADTIYAAIEKAVFEQLNRFKDVEQKPLISRFDG